MSIQKPVCKGSQQLYSQQQKTENNPKCPSTVND